jgi:hypothetical protein
MASKRRKSQSTDSTNSTTTSVSDLETSIAHRITRLTAALGEPFAADPRLAPYATALEAADGALPRSRQRPLTHDFLSRADAFLTAHEIALPIISQRSSRNEWDNVTARAAMLFSVESIRRGHVRTMTGLRSMETAFFTGWNEGPPAETSRFWQAMEQAGLPYARRDLLAEIFSRKRITSREHYEFAVDVIGAAQDEGLLDPDQVEQLGGWISAYEKR